MPIYYERRDNMKKTPNYILFTLKIKCGKVLIAKVSYSKS